MKVIELLNKIANGKIPKKIKYRGNIYEYKEEYEDYKYYELDHYTYFIDFFTEYDVLNDEVEIIEEGKELHANEIVFNFDNNKRECVITLDENDLGINELHIDNCYFYKENDKWYVRKYDFKTFNIEEEKKIPEKLDIQIQNETTGNAYITNEKGTKCYLTKHSKIIAERLNQVIDYLQSKGE